MARTNTNLEQVAEHQKAIVGLMKETASLLTKLFDRPLQAVESGLDFAPIVATKLSVDLECPACKKENEVLVENMRPGASWGC